MSEQITLEQVRDILEYVRSTCYTLENGSRVFCGDMADAIDAHLNAAKDEAVAWRYRFYGSQGWVYATAGEELVCGLPLIYSQPLYSHPAEKFEAAPYTYAYRYPDGIRTGTGGREINGCKPTEVIPLYTNPASPDVVRDAERYRIVRNYYGVDLDDSDRRVYHDALDRQLDKDISEFGAKAMAAREGGE